MVSNNLLTQKNNRVHHYGSAANVPGTPTLGLYQCRALGAGPIPPTGRLRGVFQCPGFGNGSRFWERFP